MTQRRSKLIYAIEDLDYPILLLQEGNDRFSVVYGQQAKTGLGYSAAKEKFADCLFHALALAGKFAQ